MNIFILDYDMNKNVQYHCDKHVTKMLIEYVQILSTSKHINGVNEGYKPTHAKHPAVLWASSSRENWLYLSELTRALYGEYVYRYNKTTHKSFEMFKTLSYPNEIPSNGLTSFVKTMPKEYIVDDVVQSYRNFYIYDKVRFATWKKRDIPEWMNL